MFDGGLVIDAISHPTRKGAIAVRACWTAISVRRDETRKLILHQIKNDIFVGTWKFVGLESHAKIPREIIALLEPDEVDAKIEPGDILIFGRGAVSRYATTSAFPDTASPKEIELSKGGLRGILYPRKGTGAELLIFHDPADDITSSDLGDVTVCGENYGPSLAYINTVIARYTLEFKLSGKAVLARSVIEVLTPIRSFVLDASEEICLDIPRKKGRRAEDESELFEPVITAKAASVRFRIHPSSSSRAQGLNTSAPLILLSKVLLLANSGDHAGLRLALEDSVKSVDESLKQVEAIVKSALKQKLEFSATDAPSPIMLGNRALSTIKSAEKNVRRVERINGNIYAVDLKRNWCRISTFNIDPAQDWKLEFSDDLKELVRGNYPRRVTAQFETQARLGVTSGKGRLLSISDVEALKNS